MFCPMVMVNNYKTDGIIIKRANFGEADRVLTILTPYYGKLRIIAKGSRKITSRRAPNLELFTQTSFMIHKGRVGNYVSEAKAVQPFENIRSDFDRVKVAYQIAELINILTREEEELEEVYGLLAASLYRINDGLQFSISEFKHRLLLILGFIADNSHDANLDSYIEEIAQRRLYARGIYE